MLLPRAAGSGPETPAEPRRRFPGAATAVALPMACSAPVNARLGPRSRRWMARVLHARRHRCYPALRSREPAVADVRPNGAIRIDTEAPSACAHFTSVLTPRFFTRPDSSFAT